jgi:hypothetical protein
MRRGVAVGLALAVGLAAGTATAAWTYPPTPGKAAAKFGTWVPACAPGSVTLQPGAAAGVDAEIRLGDPTSPNGNDTRMRSGTSSLSSTRETRALVRFVPAIPSGCAVTSAVLTLTRTAGTNGREIRVRAIVADWNEGVTWNTQPGTAGPGEISFTTSANGAHVLDVTASFEPWGRQFGWMVYSPDGTPLSTPAAWATSDHGTAGNWPKLEVSWA